MKNFNLLRKSERKSVGTTLALTVGSPSFDRRGTMLKHYAFMLLFLLGSLNVWGAEVEVISTLSPTKSITLNETPTNVDKVLSITGTKGTSNFPVFNYNATKGTDLRFYKGSTCSVTFSVVSGYQIESITFKKDATTASALSALSADNGTLTDNEWVATTSTQSVKFTYNNSSSNFSGQIYKIYVVYSVVGGTLSHTWDLTTNSYIAASTEQVTWSSTKDVEKAEVKMIVEKGAAETAANDYLGGDANSHTSSRFYQNSILKIIHRYDVTVTSVVFTATTEEYATALQKLSLIHI